MRSALASSAPERPEGLIETAAFAALDRRLDALAAAPIALALSGGGDSMALLHLAAAWARRQGRALLALTVDHGLNPDSARWTAGAGEAARALGASWRALAWTGDKPATGLPAAARAARHRLLAQAAREAGARVLLTGHTFDDLLEGELIRADTPQLGRLRDWSPSPAWPEGRGLFLCRPLLDLRRAGLRAWLRARAIPWLDDPANEDTRYARPRARALLVLPCEAGGGDRRQAVGEASAAPCPLHNASRVPPHPLRKRGQGGLISLPRLADARTLSAALLCASGTATPPRGAALQSLLARLHAGEDFTATLAGSRLVAKDAEVLMGRDPGRGGLPEVRTTPGQTLVWDGRFEIEAQGAAVVPLAGRMSRLSKPERIELALLPAWARPTMPGHLFADGTVRLARAVPLGPARLRAALGQNTHESDI